MVGKVLVEGNAFCIKKLYRPCLINNHKSKDRKRASLPFLMSFLKSVDNLNSVLHNLSLIIFFLILFSWWVRLKLSWKSIKEMNKTLIHFVWFTQYERTLSSSFFIFLKNHWYQGIITKEHQRGSKNLFLPR